MVIESSIRTLIDLLQGRREGAKGRAADDFYLSGFTDDDRIRIRKEILSTKAGDFAGLGDTLNDMAANSTVCVAGPKSALEACEEIEILPL